MKGNPMHVRSLMLLIAVTLLAACTKREPTVEEEVVIDETAVEETAEAEAPHQGFDTPDAAVEALAKAVAENDVTTLRVIFGPEGDALVAWGDEVAEAKDRATFTEMYEAKHEIVDGEDGEKILEIGPNGWPLPAPLYESEGQWFFDGAAGADELAYRRVGRNELGAIGVVRGFVDAQYEYASKPRDGNMAGVFATFLISDPGRQNGLYWPTKDGEPRSPAGPFVAAAAGEGYRRAASGEPTPYHGYFYRMLYAQGPDAKGGAKDYFVAGRLLGGFGLVAWPAEYEASGIQTFIVNQDGVVYQKDFGDETPVAANEIRLFNPDETWIVVEEEEISD